MKNRINGEGDTHSDELIRIFTGSHSASVAEAVAHWLHSPDCSSHARNLIRDASHIDGRLVDHKNLGFQCTFCCDSERFASFEDSLSDKKSWQECHHCKAND